MEEYKCAICGHKVKTNYVSEAMIAVAGEVGDRQDHAPLTLLCPNCTDKAFSLLRNCVWALAGLSRVKTAKVKQGNKVVGLIAEYVRRFLQLRWKNQDSRETVSLFA